MLATIRLGAARRLLCGNQTTIIVFEPEREAETVEAMFAGQAAIEVGRLLGRTVTPREITGLFYGRVVPEDLAPVVGGRRLIRPEAVEVIVATLRLKEAARPHTNGDARDPRPD